LGTSKVVSLLHGVEGLLIVIYAEIMGARAPEKAGIL